MKRATAPLLLLLISGCQTAVEVPPGTSDPAKFDAAVIAAAGTVTVIEDAPAQGTLLGRVKAHACQRFQWEPDPTEQTALILLKAEAAKIGANALSDVTFRRSNMNVALNCFGTRYAEGDAYRIP